MFFGTGELPPVRVTTQIDSPRRDIQFETSPDLCRSFSSRQPETAIHHPRRFPLVVAKLLRPPLIPTMDVITVGDVATPGGNFTTLMSSSANQRPDIISHHRQHFPLVILYQS